jgi:hypothetical protein
LFTKVTVHANSAVGGLKITMKSSRAEESRRAISRSQRRHAMHVRRIDIPTRVTVGLIEGCWTSASVHDT